MLSKKLIEFMSSMIQKTDAPQTSTGFVKKMLTALRRVRPRAGSDQELAAELGGRRKRVLVVHQPEQDGQESPEHEKSELRQRGVDAGQVS